MVDSAAPSGTTTEAFAWLATAIAVGSALGAAGAGTLIDRAGPTAAFALAGGAGAVAILTTLVRSRTLAPPLESPLHRKHPPQLPGTAGDPGTDRVDFAPA